MNPAPKTPPSTVEEVMLEGKQPKSSGKATMWKINTIEDGFSRELLYYEGIIEGVPVKILVDG